MNKIKQFREFKKDCLLHCRINDTCMHVFRIYKTKKTRMCRPSLCPNLQWLKKYEKKQSNIHC
jgi:hypothetical protein